MGARVQQMGVVVQCVNPHVGQIHSTNQGGLSVQNLHPPPPPSCLCPCPPLDTSKISGLIFGNFGFWLGLGRQKKIGRYGRG